MARLVIVQGPDLGKRYDLVEGVAVIGRHSANAVAVADPRISRRHCELHYKPSGSTLSDLGSGNGTLVNGREFTSGPLQTGDQIQIGDTILLYSTNDTTRTTSTPAANDAQFTVRMDTDQPSAFLRTIPAEEARSMLARPDLAPSDWLRQQLAILTVMYEATNAVSTIMDVDELLGRIIELIIRTTGADHGCALITDPETHELMPKALKSRAGLPVNELVLSRTVADYVMKQRVGVLLADAGADERFSRGESIARHQIREVICVPMKGRHDTVGVLFLDTKAPATSQNPANPVKFTDDHLRLAVAVAHQAALAIEETRYYQALIQSERLAAVGQTIAALSHHIKNIMQGVRFGSDMVRAGFADHNEELLGRGWRLVEKNQNKIDDLIFDMLGFSKDREPLKDITDLNSLVNDVLDVVQGRADTGKIRLEFEAGPSIVASCDPEGIHRALLNVVSNALDAVESSENPQVSIRIQKVDDNIEIIIEDNGPGIPPDKREDIFKPFVSTKGARGTGLGLPVTRKTLREHGGDAIIESTATGGTRFVLRFPAK